MMKNCRTTFASILLLVLAGYSIADDPKPPADPWEATIRKFEESDREQPPPAGANLFVGSSSVRMWKLMSGFPNQVCINRGFGGSQMGDAAKYVERIVIPCKPKVVVLYSGDNDIASGKTPESVRDAYKSFRDQLHEQLPDTKLVLISIKPSPSRWKLREKALVANRLLREETMQGTNQTFVDVWPAMLNADGLPREELFVKDQLHMNEVGYQIWNGLIEKHLQ